MENYREIKNNLIKKFHKTIWTKFVHAAKDYNLIEENAKLLNIPINMFKSDVFEVVSKYGKNEPCYLCARMRRGHLYNKVKELDCNKIALAYHIWMMLLKQFIAIEKAPPYSNSNINFFLFMSTIRGAFQINVFLLFFCFCVS